MSEQLDIGVVIDEVHLEHEREEILRVRPMGNVVLPVTSVRRDGCTQLRAAMSAETVQDYAERIEAGEPLPPVVVYDDGENYWLSDGFHRFSAHESLGHSDIPAEVRQGSRLDAIRNSAEANAIHGLPLTPADKQNAVAKLWRELPKPTQEEIGSLLHMPQRTVSFYLRRAGISNVAKAGRPAAPPKPEYEFEKKRYWNDEQRDHAKELLEQIPREEREVVAAMVTEPGTPVDLALQMVERVVQAPPEERQRKLADYQSEDERVKINAVTWAADREKEPDWRLDVTRECARQLRLCARKCPNDPETPIYQQAATLCDDAVRSIKIRGE